MHKVKVVVPAYPTNTSSAKLHLGVVSSGLLEHELTKSFTVKPGDNFLEFETFDTLENMLHYVVVFSGPDGDVTTRVRSIANTFVDDILNCDGLVNPFKQGGAGLGTLYEDMSGLVVPRTNVFSDYFVKLGAKANLTYTSSANTAPVVCISYRGRQLIDVNMGLSLYGQISTVIIPAINALINVIDNLDESEYFIHAGRKWKPVVLRRSEVADIRMLYGRTAAQANNVSAYLRKYDYVSDVGEIAVGNFFGTSYTADGTLFNSLSYNTNVYLSAYSFSFELVKE